MKIGSFVQIFLFLFASVLFLDAFILHPAAALTATGALLTAFGAVLVGSYAFWAVGNKGNPNYAGVEPGTPSWRMAFYMIMFSYIVIYEVLAFVIAGHNPLSGLIENIKTLALTKEQLMILVLPLLMIMEYYEPG